MDSPCRTCENRHKLCHSECELYKQYRIDLQKENFDEHKISKEYVCQSIYRREVKLSAKNRNRRRWKKS
jgi:hypothetical protein